MSLLIAVALILTTAVLLFLHFWVLDPFERITQSLISGQPDSLKSLLSNRTEIGLIARPCAFTSPINAP